MDIRSYDETGYEGISAFPSGVIDEIVRMHDAGMVDSFEDDDLFEKLSTGSDGENDE